MWCTQYSQAVFPHSNLDCIVNFFQVYSIVIYHGTLVDFKDKLEETL